MIWWILAGLAAFIALQAWAWRDALSWPYGTQEGDETMEDEGWDG